MRTMTAEARWLQVARGSRMVISPKLDRVYPRELFGARQAAGFASLRFRPPFGAGWLTASGRLVSSEAAVQPKADKTGCADCPTSMPKVSECWNCNERHSDSGCTGALFCHGCGAMQPPDPSLSYFTLLAVPGEGFDLDKKSLEEQYKNLMRELHSDRYMQKSPTEQAFSSVRDTPGAALRPKRAHSSPESNPSLHAAPG